MENGLGSWCASSRWRVGGIARHYLTLKAQSTGLSTFTAAATAAAATQAGIACVVVVVSFIVESSHIEMSRWRVKRVGGKRGGEGSWFGLQG